MIIVMNSEQDNQNQYPSGNPSTNQGYGAAPYGASPYDNQGLPQSMAPQAPIQPAYMMPSSPVPMAPLDASYGVPQEPQQAYMPSATPAYPQYQPPADPSPYAAPAPSMDMASFGIPSSPESATQSYSAPDMGMPSMPPMPDMSAPAPVSDMPGQAPSYESSLSASAYPPSDYASNQQMTDQGQQYEMRTLATDEASMQQSGGMEAAPQSFVPSTFGGNMQTYNPEMAVIPPKSRGQMNKMLIFSAIGVALVGMGMAGYFILKPVVSPSSPSLLENATTTEEAATTTEEAIVTIPKNATTTPETPIVVKPHISSFIIPADSIQPKTLATVDALSLRGLMAINQGEIVTAGMMKELIIDSSAGPIPFSTYGSIMMSDAFPSSPALANVFEDDFTPFAYYSKTEFFPGFIVKVKTGIAEDQLKAFSASLESMKNFSNFYATDIGTMGAWMDSTITALKKPTRYVKFANGGYAFNYGWFKTPDGSTYLLASASYAGMQEAMRRSGFDK